MTTNATNHEQAVVALLGDIRQKLVEAVTAGAHGCGDPLQYALGVMGGWDLPDAAGTMPSGYAYRYPDGAIRFSNGETINGSGPTESIPYYFGAPPAGSDANGEAVGSVGEDAGLLRFLQTFAVAYIDSRLAAAPERSGKAADEKPYGWAAWHRLGAVELCMIKPRAELYDRIVPLYTRPAGNSSAAPSDIAGLVVRDVCELSYEGEFNPETMMVVSAEDLTRIVSRHALAAPAPEAHPDDIAVDLFAVAMKDKMAKSRAKGRSGWDNETLCSANTLQGMLADHVVKGDPVDVGNFAMMLFNRGERASAAGGDERRHGTLYDAIQRACGELPYGYEIRVELERDCGMVQWSDLDGADHMIDGEGYLCSDVDEALEQILALSKGGAT